MSVGSDTENAPGEDRHVQLTFVSKEKEFVFYSAIFRLNFRLLDLPEAVFDVPVTADPENLNILLNKTIVGVKGLPIPPQFRKHRLSQMIGKTNALNF